MLLFFCPNAGLANTGVFFGAGSQVIPIKNNDVQLVKERVSIKLRVDEDAGKWGTPFFPRADVEAEFVLKNTTDKPIKLQVGFPFLDLQGFGDEKLVLSKLNFQAKDTDAERKVTLKEGLIEKELDPQGLFKKVFSWEEQFQPNQTKKVIVSYRLLMGVASANENDRRFDGVDRKYHALDRMFPALAYSFGYITKTAYTWKEPVDNAVFTIDGTEYFQKLEEANFFKELGETSPAMVTRPVFLSNLNPASFTHSKNVYRWEFTGKVPEEGIGANFIVLFIPSLSSELPEFVTEQVKTLKEGVTKEEYLSILEGYYTRIIKKGTEGDKPFVQKYFEPVGLIKNDILFEKDKKLLQSVIDKVKALTRN
jgi:hypothetical protein